MSNGMDKLLDVAQKTVDKGRDKVDDYVLEKRQAKLHRQLGALVYSQRKAGKLDEDALDYYVREIDKVKTMMDAMRDQPEEEASVKIYTCPSCGAGVAKDAMFCGRCGEELPAE